MGVFLLVTILNGVEDGYRQKYRSPYCHMLMTRHGVWTDNLIYWPLITTAVSLIYTHYKSLQHTLSWIFILSSLVVARVRMLTMEIPHRQPRTATAHLQLTTPNRRL
jgi:hypothetical protein